MMQGSATALAEVVSSDLLSDVPDFVQQLELKLGYLTPEARARVRHAYFVGAAAHGPQARKSGEPYITHPVAVAGLLADMRLDSDALVAAILHDTIEDTILTRVDLERSFGTDVADLVEGVTKLDKIEFRSRQEAQAESFRKMMLAMSRDLRVILIKLADRLHNMRTLDAMSADSRRRIARETLEIYAPIAQRLGMNAVKAELQDLGFRALYPMRYRILTERLGQSYRAKRESMQRLEASLAERLRQMGIAARLVNRVKSPYSVYRKMRDEHKSFGDVLDVLGVRVVVADVMHCYMALGVVHALFKPLDGRFKDFIAIPKANGYQSLHSLLFGSHGAPIEVQIRTEEMDVLAERGIAAHWAYKTDAQPANAAQVRAREWLTNLLSQQSAESSSLEFVENVRVDLFPDDVYVFTPAGDIMSLPRNATALDFAYAVHTRVGGHAVAARVDGRLAPLRTRLQSGQRAEIITAPSAQPSPDWLSFVVSSKARTAIRQHLKRMQHEDAIDLGHRMLDRALSAQSRSLDSVPSEVLDNYLTEHRMRRLEDLLADIALGNRMPQQVAMALTRRASDDAPIDTQREAEKILISGAERGVLSFGVCCHPIPGDPIMGYLSSGKGVVVHRADCPNVPEFRKTPERLVPVDWDRNVEGEYRVQVRAVVANRPGVLATVASAIAVAEANIENVEYQERDVTSAALLFTIEVRDRKHLSEVLRRVRRAEVVHTVQRHPA
jgi:guanosine-3',5'-bis(diphosphate) 3'-pyrophosphohydrolase